MALGDLAVNIAERAAFLHTIPPVSIPFDFELKRVAGWDRIVGVIERERGEKYAAFANRHGDSGRDLVLYLARHNSGLTLGQIGELAGGLEYKTVGKAVQRCESRIGSPKTASDRALCRIARKCERHLSNVEIRP